MANFIDKAVNFFSPARGARRMMVRAATESDQFSRRITSPINGGYYRGGRNSRKMSDWSTSGWDADAYIADAQSQLRDDSNDLMLNNPIANGAVQTKVTNVVGSGLTMQSKVDHEFIGMSEEQAIEWQKEAERHWKLFSVTADMQLGMTMAQMQALVYQSILVSGDIFINMPVKTRKGVMYETAINLIESHLVSNPGDQPDTATRKMGIDFDKRGIPKTYWVRQQHPGATPTAQTEKQNNWVAMNVFDRDGRKLILHIFDRLRPGQSRGVPMLAPIIEPIKKLDTWTEAEIDNAVISSFFTVFIKTNFASDKVLDVVTNLGDETSAVASDKDLKLASGNIVRLFGDEDVTFANPNRPNSNFEVFFKAITQQIAIALNMPVEVLLKSFNASYTASRGALLEVWKHFLTHRAWIAKGFCQPIYEAMLYEAIAKGWMSAPGFLTDPLVRMAYSGSVWVGPELGELDPLKEAKARSENISNGTTNEFIETQKKGLDYEQDVFPGRSRAHQMQEEAGLLVENMQNPVPDTDSENDEDDEEDANA